MIAFIDQEASEKVEEIEAKVSFGNIVCILLTLITIAEELYFLVK